MDISLIIYFILFIAIIVLIFKLIKKIIVAVFTVIFFIILIIAGVGGLVYFDYKSIVEQDSYNINLFYGLPENEVDFGLSFPIKDNQIQKENIASFDVTLINDVYLDDSEENEFNIFVSKDLFESILIEDKDYYLAGTEDINLAGFEVETALSKKEVLQIINSEDSTTEYINLLFEKNSFPSVPGINPEEYVEGLLEEQLNGLDIDHALFVSTLSNLENEQIITLLEGFKEDELTVYPEKFTFKALKMLPINTIKENLPEVESSE